MLADVIMIIDPAAVLYLNHVPKCGGTTVADLFCRAFPADAVQDRFSLEGAQTLLPSELAKKRLMAAHLPEWVMRRRLQPYQKIGLARAPWPRFKSIVRHYLRDIEAGAPPLHTGAFFEALDRGDVEAAFDTISDWYRHDSLAAFYAADAISAYGDLDALAQSAIARIETYDLIVCCEDIDALFPLLCRLTNQPEMDAPRLNDAAEFGNASCDLFGAELEARFKDAATYEYRVFDALKARAEKTAQNLRNALDRRPTYRRAIASRAFDKVDVAIEASEPVAAVGWDRPVLATGGRHVGRYGLRLNGDKAFIDFGVPTGQRLFVEIIVWIGGGLTALGSIRLRINNQPMTLENCVVEDVHDRCSMVLIMEHAPIIDGFCRLEFMRADTPAPGAGDLWVFSVRARAAAAEHTAWSTQPRRVAPRR